MWGLIATGLFTTREGWELTYGERGGDRADECCGLFYGCGFSLLFANLALLVSILVWVGGLSTILFYAIDVRLMELAIFILCLVPGENFSRCSRASEKKHTRVGY